MKAPLLLPPLPRWDDIQKEIGVVREMGLLAETFRNSVYKAVTDKGEFVVKHARRGWGKYEYESMNRLGAEGFQVPEPIGFFETDEAESSSFYNNLQQTPGILVYKFIPGESLSDIMTKKLLKKTADEIKKIHEDERHIKDEAFIEDYKGTERGRMKYHLERLGDGFNDLKNKLEVLSEEYESEETKYTTIHGDFRPANVIVNDDEIYLIDFEGTCDGGDRFKDIGICYAELLVHNPGYAEFFREGYGTEVNASLKFHTIRRLLVLASFEDVEKEAIKEKIRYVLET